MKTIKMMTLAVAITFSSAIFASETSVKEEPTTLKEKITQLLKNPNFIVDKDLYANVTLMFNKNGELVVLAVDSESELAESYIKSRLNYKKINVAVESLNKTFVLPVKIAME